MVTQKIIFYNVDENADEFSEEEVVAATPNNQMYPIHQLFLYDSF